MTATTDDMKAREAAALADFRDYIHVNYGPGCVLSDPQWHAPKLFRAAVGSWLAAMPVPLETPARMPAGKSFALYVSAEDGTSVLTIATDGTLWVHPDRAGDAARLMVTLYKDIMEKSPLIAPAPEQARGCATKVIP